jgi:glycosyltransferase involved in cell wall biosynthesis
MTYNQEDFIAEAINSCLNQIIKPFELIILDDHSIDSTWEKVKDYEKLYPSLIKAYRNEKNSGIYYSYEKIKSLASGNVFTYLAGDDFLLPQCIKDVNEAILINSLNPNIDKFIIVTNNMCFYNNKEEKVVYNNFKLRFKLPIKTMLRQSLGYRGVGISKPLHNEVLDTYMLSLLKPHFKYSIDSIKGIDEVIKADKIIFIETISTAQRLGVGITLASSSHQLTRESIDDFVNYLKFEYSNYFDQRDILFIDYLKARMNLISYYNISNFVKFVLLLYRNRYNFDKNDPFWRQLRFLIPREFLTHLKRLRN